MKTGSDGNHDDLMMNLVLFGYFVSGTYFRDMTDINLKEIMFADRMKEIEQDVVPVGFIDDGSQYINEIENKEQGWIQTPYNQDDVEDWI